MSMFVPKKISFYKRFRLTFLLIRLLSDDDKWIRYHAVLALQEMGNPRVITALKAMVRDDKPGWWLEDIDGIVRNLKKHYRNEDEVLDEIDSYIHRHNQMLLNAAQEAIAYLKTQKKQ
jgi:HEAT repeat protein